jgi:hypothetical protein
MSCANKTRSSTIVKPGVIRDCTHTDPEHVWGDEGPINEWRDLLKHTDARQTCGPTIVRLKAGGTDSYAGCILAVRFADASTLAPYSYVRLVVATAGALLIFGEIPDALTIVGASSR